MELNTTPKRHIEFVSDEEAKDRTPSRWHLLHTEQHRAGLTAAGFDCPLPSDQYHCPP